MADSEESRLEDVLELYISQVQALLGAEYRYATASGIVQEDGLGGQHTDIVIYVSKKAKNVLAENAVEALTLEFCRNYQIRLSASLQEMDHFSF